MNSRLNRILFSLVIVGCVMGLAMNAMAKDYVYAPCVNFLHIIDCDTDSVVKTLEYNDYIIGCEGSYDGKQFFFTSFKKVYVVDTDKMEIVDVLNFWTDLNRVSIMPGMAVSRDGKYLYMSWAVTQKKLNVPRLTILPPQVVKFDLKKKQIVGSWEVQPCALGIFTTKDPNKMIVYGQDVEELNLKNGERKKMLGILHPDEGQPGLNSLFIWSNKTTGDHDMFVNAAYTAEDLRWVFIDKNKGELTKVLVGKELFLCYSAVLSPDQKHFYAQMDEVYKVDAETGETVAMTVSERGTVYALNLTSDGKKLYSGPAGPDMSVYDTATMKRIGMIPLKSDGIVAQMIVR